MSQEIKTEAEIRKEVEAESERTKKATENKWHEVVQGYKKEIADLILKIDRKDQLIAEQEKVIGDQQKQIRKLDDKVKESEADFVFLSKQRKEEGLVQERPSRPNLLTDYLKKKGRI